MDSLLIHRDATSGIVTATLNRPQRKNALDLGLMQGLRQLFADVRANQNDRVLVLTGAGDAFCSGSDLGDRKNDPRHPLERMRWIGDIALGLQQITKPTIAKVNGVAVGGGMALALGCDLIVMSDTAKMAGSWCRRGLSPDLGASWLLPRLVGLHRAKEIAFLADMLSANEAFAMGVINKVVPHASLDACVDDMARQLAEGPPLALSMAKELLTAGLSSSMAEALAAEAQAQAVNARSEDGAEAIDAFMQKRTPSFQGR